MESSNGRPCARLILSGVVAYVDVWSSNRTENYSKGFIQQLLDMGAKVSKTFSKQVTHVVFKEGHWSTWNKAQKTGIKLVSVLWVEKCREVRACVDESLYPAINTNEGLPQQIRKHKCMQPRDFVEKTPENDRRLQKKLRTMAKDLEVQKATTEVDIPVLLFEDDGSLFYSPTSKIQYESSSMEKRIMDMKERRENLSPTASQMSQVSGSSSVQATQEPVIVSASSTWVLSGDENKLCKFDGNDDYLEVREPNKKLQTTGRIKKPLRTLVMTSMCSEQKNTVVQVAKKLGNFLFSNEVCENTSHVISGSPRRTLNVLLGIARGCWIVSFEWVLWSLEYGHWISEEPYELSVDFPAAPICRVQQYLSETNNKKLFSDQPVMFVSLTSQPPFYKLCELIQLCGGKLCKTIRQAEICIGKCRVGRHRGIQCLSEKWILDSVIQNKICPLGRYIYQNKD
ncbi:microcephalin isoform X6 [Sphaerodactylus townsendi]|uniref:microcephalin isoform X6 n=1 Tax=Sphaerodactylus townsendi TaxID=933632 RepID=UPI0020268A0E|nr:microcephalin isoform X6 [Sphaerodactylus townsendi]